MTGSRTYEQLCELAAHLTRRRNEILTAWRSAVDLDPELNTASTSTRFQFVDHIPSVLDAFESRLCAADREQKAQARADEKESAAEHGTHRWQQGYNLPESIREWGHLHLCLLEELERYGVGHLNLERDVMLIARRELVRLSSYGASASAERYSELQQAEAASRMRDLESALVQLKTLDVARVETWREAAHDLRGSAHVIANATAVLNREVMPDAKRIEFCEILRIGVASLNTLLIDLLDHARLEAGEEHRHVTEFDVAALLREFCETLRPLADSRNLFLKCEGPSSLVAEGDAAKIQRILQNLVLNALKSTEHGGVLVTWKESGAAERPQWVLSVQDTGPGFKTASATPLKQVLSQATAEAREIEERTQLQGEMAGRAGTPPTLASQSRLHDGSPPSGEGIGLSIIKRLCELLDASLELETAQGKGTTFRVTFPRRYALAAT